ncbi:putative porin [Leeuwenhoekiella sp. NPDC079379]|uniref:putative porin n=1 Tax=Leeuwenhoekiella sp. NPDC079379 TaxID=3364122 RepID=UPI0037C7C656
MTQTFLMRNSLLFIIGLFFGSTLFAQVDEPRGLEPDGDSQSGSIRPKAKKEQERPPIELYKMFTVDNDTTIVDTSLTIQKLYKYNYLRKDNFGLLPFSNEGQTYNTLLYSFSSQRIRPLFGARARHFNYMEVKDMLYYEVPTPLSELYYKSVFEQGQNLDAFFTMNTSRRFNFSIAYKGLRSLGKYQHILTSTGNFRFTTNYKSKNNRYELKAHYVAQDLLNQENGGLTNQALINFAGNDSQFQDRSRLSVNFENAESILDGQRIYINHKYDLIQQNDSVSNNRIEVGHIFNYDDKYYEYRQTAPSSLFGNSFVTTNLRDKVDVTDLNNELWVKYTNNILGSISFQVNHTYYKYGYNSVLIQENNRILNVLNGNLIAAGVSFKKAYRGFQLKGEAQANISGDFDGYDLKAEASYQINEDATFSGGIHLNAAAANYNHLLYQSSYENYNWYNAENYDTVKTNSLDFSIKSNKWLNASASFVNIKDYAYFAIDPATSQVNSFQTNDNITYLKLKASKEFRFGKFALDNTVAYQTVSSGDSFLNVPEITTRNTVYYTDNWFKKALFVQTGVSLNYFTEYAMNGYDPVLAEFYVQNDQELGSFPLIDLFFNMKVRQTRIFFIAEHINSLASNNNYYSAPGYPYRDFTLRFGLVWNFFL